MSGILQLISFFGDIFVASLIRCKYIIYNLAEHFSQISVHMMKNISLNCCNRKLCLVFNLYSTESLIPIISVETITARKPGRSLLLTIILKANKLLYILFSCYMLKFVIPFLH